MLILQLCHPQTVEIAVGIYRDSLIAAEAEAHVRSIAGLQRLALTAVLGLEIDPLDVMLGNHGMIHGADIDADRAVGQGDDGQMLFAARLDGVGHESLHFLTAADEGNAGIVYHADQIAAVTADIELGFH